MKGDPNMKAMKRVNVILGAALFLAPFVLGYSDNTEALLTSLILGVIIGVLSFYGEFEVSAAFGAVAFIAPWVIGFDGESSALWSFLLLGGATALLNSFIDFVNVEGAELARLLQQHHTGTK
jgi:VIT1/CCC1 family predicted Fe2+/Mn2+ transporter